jgi:hypothetical protein
LKVFHFIDDVYAAIDRFVTHVSESLSFFEKTKVLVVQVADVYLLFPSQIGKE